MTSIDIINSFINRYGQSDDKLLKALQEFSIADRLKFACALFDQGSDLDIDDFVEQLQLGIDKAVVFLAKRVLVL